MALRGAAKAEYMRRYMRARRAQDRTFGWEAELAADRRRMRKAVRRLATAERWKSEHPEEKIDERLLSLAWHWNQITVEEEEQEKALDKKLKTQFRLRKSLPLIQKAVAKALRAPTHFESLP